MNASPAMLILFGYTIHSRHTLDDATIVLIVNVSSDVIEQAGHSCGDYTSVDQMTLVRYVNYLRKTVGITYTFTDY